MTKKQPLSFSLDRQSASIAEAAPEPHGQPKPLAGEARKQVGARIPASLYRQLKARAALEGVPVQELLEAAVASYLRTTPAQ